MEQRLAELNLIRVTDEMGDALLRFRKIGVRFLVVLGEHGPRASIQNVHRLLFRPTVRVFIG